jgi:hypothetical protein
MVAETCRLTAPHRIVGKLQTPPRHSWWLPDAPQGVWSWAFASIPVEQFAAVGHWFTPRHAKLVKLWVCLHVALQFTAGQFRSLAGATQAPVPGEQVAQRPEQAPAQQNPPVQMPVWH